MITTIDTFIYILCVYCWSVIHGTEKMYDLYAKQLNYHMTNICFRNRSSINTNFYGFRYRK